MDDMGDLLEPIIEYNMTELEAKAYKIGLLWVMLMRKTFPNMVNQRGYPKKGDPRNSHLFRNCYTLIKETHGLIPDNEYKLYIKAQMDMLRAIQIGDAMPFIDPGIMIGDKAWIRWKMWRRKYDAITKRQTLEDVGLTEINLDKVKKDLEKTKKYFYGRFEGQPKEEHIIMACGDIARWIDLGKVSPYYALLSPWVKRHCKIPIDGRYKVLPELEEFFKKTFDYEV